ncbi:hypothetical protein LZ30DRAFT_465113 [Colletotrichum cereale]|nr:hypothetical protein LZ30DRAFT_465113 [Colletotrichum cereale]
MRYQYGSVVAVPAGAEVGARWAHSIDGPLYPNDVDHPIAASHKGMAIPWVSVGLMLTTSRQASSNEIPSIRVEGNGKGTPSSLVKFPGAYSATDPSILLSIYDNNGLPTNGGRPYTIPGPKIISCNPWNDD